MNESLIELKYFSEQPNSDLDNAFRFSLSRFGFKNTSTEMDKEHGYRILGFDKGITYFTWLHADIRQQKLYHFRCLDLKAEYDIAEVRINQTEGVFYITEMVFDPEEYYKDSKPESLKADSLTGRAMMLNVTTYDEKNDMYRPIGIHGCVTTDIRKEFSGGCIMLSNYDAIQLYENVDITTPIVISRTRPFQNIVPTELVLWAQNNGTRALPRLLELSKEAK